MSRYNPESFLSGSLDMTNMETLGAPSVSWVVHKKGIKNAIYFKYHLIFVDVSIQSRIVPLGITRQDKYGDLGCSFGVFGGSKEIKNKQNTFWKTRKILYFRGAKNDMQ